MTGGTRARRVLVLGPVLGLALLTIHGEAEAQCGAGRSSCTGCHDGLCAEFSARTAWHEQHAFADVCTACHGGNGETKELTAAHAGLVDPLGGSGESCASCHPAEVGEYVERYRALPSGSAATVATAAAARGRAVGPGRPRALHGRSLPNTIAAALLGAVGAAGGFAVARSERRARRLLRDGRGGSLSS